MSSVEYLKTINAIKTSEKPGQSTEPIPFCAINKIPEIQTDRINTVEAMKQLIVLS